jgi:glycosyltransferase involved in cell wall biosynthesis
MSTGRPTLRILGSRGIPAAHGGFETFAERLALHLAGRGWRVIVYCQETGRGPVRRDVWRGVERVRIGVQGTGAMATVVFDWLSISDAIRQPGLCLTLGYNTALFCLRLRAAGIVNIMNMDGIEWRRAKWSPLVKAWFWLNDWAGCWLADHLVADHPEIAAHLRTRTRASRISTIVYGADAVHSAPTDDLDALGLQPQRYLLLIARAEPENSVLEIVRTFSRRPRGVLLVVVGDFPADDVYARAVRSAAGAEIRFVGPTYDAVRLAVLRCHCLAYVHGHRVGGTNPSLVEALGAGNAVIAHDNRFNRWVAQGAARYFDDDDALDAVLQQVTTDSAALQALRLASRQRFEQAFSWDAVLAAYESLLTPRAIPS